MDICVTKTEVKSSVSSFGKDKRSASIKRMCVKNSFLVNLARNLTMEQHVCEAQKFLTHTHHDQRQRTEKYTN